MPEMVSTSQCSSREEIVRCNDCRFYDYFYDPFSDECICSDCTFLGIEVDADNFCSHFKEAKHER